MSHPVDVPSTIGRRSSVEGRVDSSCSGTSVEQQLQLDHGLHGVLGWRRSSCALSKPYGSLYTCRKTLQPKPDHPRRVDRGAKHPTLYQELVRPQ
ncbi:hypothetical protein D3C86_1781730 [compost metagenome]